MAPGSAVFVIVVVVLAVVVVAAAVVAVVVVVVAAVVQRDWTIEVPGGFSVVFPIPILDAS